MLRVLVFGVRFGGYSTQTAWKLNDDGNHDAGCRASLGRFYSEPLLAEGRGFRYASNWGP